MTDRYKTSTMEYTHKYPVLSSNTPDENRAKAWANVCTACAIDSLAGSSSPSGLNGEITESGHEETCQPTGTTKQEVTNQ